MFIKAKTEKKKTYETPKSQAQKRNPPCHVLIKALSVWNKERTIKSDLQGEKTYKGKPINTGLFDGNSGSEKGLDREMVCRLLETTNTSPDYDTLQNYQLQQYRKK